MASHALALLVLILSAARTLASHPSPLQDFCVADKGSHVFVNGVVCKNPADAKAEDFFFSGLDKPGKTNNALGSNVTAVNVNNLAGLNTLGISLARVDFGRRGLNPPHIHPRATEVLVVLKGKLYVGFVTSNPPKLFAKTLHKGDVFVFPQGLVHFQLNTGEERAIALAALSSQNPGVVTVANAVFGSSPAIEDDVLAKAFQVDEKLVDHLQSQFWTDNN